METIISLATRQIYDITATKHGENNMPCPECSTNRRKKNTKCFSYNAEKEIEKVVNTMYLKYRQIKSLEN